MRTAIYARISKKDKQETENQLRELRGYCKKMGWPISKVYVDKITGSRADRDEFQTLFADAHQRKFDLLLFWALDRFSREGALETLKHLERLTSYGVGWKSYTEQYLDSAGIFKDAIVSIMATLAKQERVKISERTIAGLQTARAKGKQLGRPKKIFDRRRLIQERKKGRSLGQLANEFKLSRTHVARLTKTTGSAA